MRSSLIVSRIVLLSVVRTSTAGILTGLAGSAAASGAATIRAVNRAAAGVRGVGWSGRMAPPGVGRCPILPPILTRDAAGPGGGGPAAAGARATGGGTGPEPDAAGVAADEPGGGVGARGRGGRVRDGRL